MLTYEQWLEVNADEASIRFAETGVDRELDFDPERELERMYEEYVARYEMEARLRLQEVGLVAAF